MFGDMQKVGEWADYLKETDPRYHAFASKVWEFAEHWKPESQKSYRKMSEYATSNFTFSQPTFQIQSNLNIIDRFQSNLKLLLTIRLIEADFC